MSTPIIERTLAYPDTTAVAEFMNAFGQPVRTTPTDQIDPDEARLRVRLVVEEALEFAAAMGFNVTSPSGEVVPNKEFGTVETGEGIDLVEATDALVDLNVVSKGSGHTIGVDLDSAFIVVHRSNMAKIGPDGIKKDENGKVMKPEGWEPPTEAIRALLIADGWTPR